MEIIKPCPFCGGNAELKQTGRTKLRIRCTKCLIGLEQRVKYLSLEFLEERLIEDWNKRYLQNQLVDNLKVLKLFRQDNDSIQAINECIRLLESDINLTA